MAMNAPAPQSAPTPIAAPIPAVPAAPTAAPETAAGETQVHAATPKAPHQGTATSPQTLQQVLEARRAALEGGGQPNSQVQPPSTQTPNSENPPVAPTPENANLGQHTPDPVMQVKDQIYDMVQNNPAQLLAMLQAAQPPAPVTPANTEPARMTPEQYQQTLYVEAQERIQSRPRITADGLFGADNAEELGIMGKDFSGDLEQFVHATLAPVLGTLLSNMYALQHHFDQQFTEVRPVLETHQFTASQREAGKQLAEVFPALGKGEQAAIQYADKRFNELAPILLPPEILNNPQSNPKEYARIMTSIAKIAANEYSALPPASIPAVPPTMPNTANVSPEPQPIAPAYRNHLGQFRGTQTPRTLDEFNKQRMEVLFPPR